MLKRETKCVGVIRKFIRFLERSGTVWEMFRIMLFPPMRIEKLLSATCY